MSLRSVDDKFIAMNFKHYDAKIYKCNVKDMGEKKANMLEVFKIYAINIY